MKIDPQDKKRRLLTNVHGLRRQLYMSANVADAPLRIPCGSAKQAQKLRFGLYASARVAKQNPDVDPEFLAAAENVIATVEGETVVLTRAELTDEGQAATQALLALGLKPESGGVHSIAARVAEERAMKAANGGFNGTNAEDLVATPALTDAHFSGMPEFPTIRTDARTEATPTNPYPRRNALNF